MLDISDSDGSGSNGISWWLGKTGEERARTMSAFITRLENVQSDRTEILLRYMSLYSNRSMTDLSSVYSGDGGPNMPTQLLNKTSTLVDTHVSKSVLNEARCAFFAEDGDWEASMRAEGLNTAMFGEFERMDVYPKSEFGFRDALVCGDGWLKLYKLDGRPYIERVFPLEPIYDLEAALSSPIKDMYQRRWLPEDTLLALAKDGEQREAILASPTGYAPYTWPYSNNRRMRRLDEGWRLPVGDEPGRHVLAINGICLVDEPWTHRDFPFVRISWQPDIAGGYSVGLVEELAPLQLELNVFLKRDFQAVKLFAVPRILQAAGTRITPEYDARIGQVYKYAGIAPVFDTASTHIAPDLLARVEFLLTEMEKKARLSEMESGQMQSRNDSQPALQDAIEIANTGTAWVQKMWERVFVNVAKQIMRVASSIPGYSTAGRDKNTLHKYLWKDIALDEDSVSVRMAPANPAALSPTGKRKAARELINYGVITDPQEIAQVLIDIPDVQAILTRETSDRQLIEKQLWQITRKKKQTYPDTFVDPIRALKMSRQVYMQAALQDAPANVLDMLTIYIQAAEALLPQPPPQVPAAPVDPASQGAPNGINAGSIPGVPGNPLDASLGGGGPGLPGGSAVPVPGGPGLVPGAGPQ